MAIFFTADTHFGHTNIIEHVGLMCPGFSGEYLLFKQPYFRTAVVLDSQAPSVFDGSYKS